MAVNVGKDLNLTGAAILSDKLALNVSGNINKKDLQDSYTSESMSLGASTSMNFGGSGTGAGSSNGSGDSGNVGKTNSNPNQPTIIGSGDKPNQFPGGSTTISGSYSQNESSRTTYATIGSLSATLLDDSDPNKLRLTSSTNSMIGADFEGGLTIDHRFLSESGRANIASDFTNLGSNLNKNPLTPMGLSIILENYTGRELSWKPGDVARFKEKGREFETAVPGALTIGKANVIDPNDPKNAGRLYLIGQPITADPDYYEKKLTWANEGGAISAPNVIPGFNSMSVFHDKFTQETFLGKEGLLELSIIPAIPINYYGLIGKELRNLYEEPKNNNSTRGAK